MSARRLLLAAAVATFGLTLAGCVDGGPYYGAYTYSDYDGSYYDPGYYSPGYYSPGYYGGGVVYGGYYTSRRGHYDRRHHRRDPSYYRDRDRRNHADRGGNHKWQGSGGRGSRSRHTTTGSSGGRYVVPTHDTRENGRRTSRNRNNEQQ
jgi:hypothetical protein